MPTEGTNDVFARAYASAILKNFPAGFNKETEILTICPLNQRGIAGGDYIPAEITNYMMYKLGDSVVSSSDLTFGGTPVASYIKSLQTYTNHIDTKSNPSYAVKIRMQKATVDAELKSDEYNTVFRSAIEVWKEMKQYFPGLTIWQWASSNYPALGSAKKRMDAAYTELDQASQLFYGPQAAELHEIKAKIRDAQDMYQTFAGLNQKGIPGDLSNLDEVIKKGNDGEKVDSKDLTSIFVPNYFIHSYSATLTQWIALGGQPNPKRDAIIEIDVKQGISTTWEDYGYKKTEISSGIGLFPFFTATVRNGSEEEKYELHTEGKETEVSLTISAIGITMLRITSGEWDYPGIKTHFPDLVPDAPNVFDPSLAKVSGILVGYNVAVKAKFKGSMRDEAKKRFESAKSSGGSISIFGFLASARGSSSSVENVQTNFDRVTWDDKSDSIEIAATPGQVYPSVLAILARRL